jgi:hypothetical protein
LLSELAGLTLEGRGDAIHLRVSIAQVDGGITLFPAHLGPELGRFARRLQQRGVQLGVSGVTSVDLRSGHIIPSPQLVGAQEASIERSMPEDAPEDRIRIVEPIHVDTLWVTGVSQGVSFEPVGRSIALQRMLAGSVINLDAVGGATAALALGPLVAQASCYAIGGLGHRDRSSILTSLLVDRKAPRSG